MNEKNSHARSKRTNLIIRNTIIYIILTVMAVVWLIPFVYLLAQSFGKNLEANYFFPREWTFDNYKNLFVGEVAKTYPFWRWWLNTFFIASVSAIFKTCLVLMSSYALSRLRFKSRKLLMKLVLILGMFPGFLGMIVVYFTLSLLNLTGPTMVPITLIIIYCSGSLMDYYIAKGFFDTISKSLDEAAMIDGASKNTIFWKIIMPLSKPIVVYTILMAFTGPWGDFMLPSILMKGDRTAFNVAVGLKNHILGDRAEVLKNFPLFCAGGAVTSLPIIILFFWLQKYYVQGITGGAVKG